MQSPQIFGEAYEALIAARGASMFVGPFGGARAPIPLAGVGMSWPPHWASAYLSAGVTTTIDRLYYIPYYFQRAGITFTGLKSENNGTGDSGETYRQGVYTADPVTGLPSTLVADCGLVTLDGSANVIRTLASSWTTPYEGWGYLCHHGHTALGVYAITNTSGGGTAVGVMVTVPQIFMFGADPTTFQITNYTPGFGGYYVDTTFGALAATAVAPTGFVASAPAIAPYKT